MAFTKEKQTVSSSEILQNLANSEQIQLSQCTITGILDVNRLFNPSEKFDTSQFKVEDNGKCKIITFSQNIVFDRCDFEENVVFAAPWSAPDTLRVCFDSETIFNRSVFHAQARFRNARFQSIAGFDGCTFEGVATFKNAIFFSDAKFRTALFKGYCLLGNSEFKESARFTNTHFVRGTNLSGSKFLGVTDFGGVYSSSKSVPHYGNVHFGRKRFGEDESFWRFVKQSAEDAGYYGMSGESFYNERCAGLNQKLWGSDFVEIGLLKKIIRLGMGIRLLPEFIFGRILFGYGERPARVLFASAFIILMCALFYTQQSALLYHGEPANPSFAQSLYFSTITFTTLGYGDIHPSPEGFCRTLAMFEAVAGGCLMALFVVCLSKRFSRG
jgi:uncharacterized protein YjbI with pentapeptide repeats